MRIKAVVFFLLTCTVVGLGACENHQAKVPEPHLELGQRVNFVGDDPDRTYVVTGYRQLLEDKTDKNWNDQAYVVVVYTNNQGDIKEGVIPRHAILKR